MVAGNRGACVAATDRISPGRENDDDRTVRPGARCLPSSARLDRLPGTRHVWLLITLLSLGGMFEFYDLFMTAYVVPGLVKSGLLAHVGVSIVPPARRLFVAATFTGPVHRHFRVWLCGRQIRAADQSSPIRCCGTARRRW